MTPEFVLDNSVFSLLYSERPRDVELLNRYEEILAPSIRVFLPFQTLGEALAGAETARWGERRKKTIYRLAALCEVVQPSWATLRLYSVVVAHSHHIGRRLSAGDAWIAATAVEVGAPLLHHDNHFEDLSLPGLSTVTLL